MGELPGYCPWLMRWFSGYTRRYFRRHFHALRVLREGIPLPYSRQPVVVYLNHPGWWDPLTCLLLGSHLFPGRRLFAPMDETQLQRYPMFKKLGLFGIEPGTPRGGLALLRTARGILDDPNRMLWITPEGCFRDPRQRPILMEEGLGCLARRFPQAVFLPLALEYTFWNERLPEALASFGSPLIPAHLAKSDQNPERLSRRLAQGLESTMDLLAAGSMERDPSRFVTLQEGRHGVGLVYDAWRRLRALRQGWSYQKRHELREES